MSVSGARLLLPCCLRCQIAWEPLAAMPKQAASAVTKSDLSAPTLAVHRTEDHRHNVHHDRTSRVCWPQDLNKFSTRTPSTPSGRCRYVFLRACQKPSMIWHHSYVMSLKPLEDTIRVEVSVWMHREHLNSCLMQICSSKWSKWEMWIALPSWCSSTKEQLRVSADDKTKRASRFINRLKRCNKKI